MKFRLKKKESPFSTAEAQSKKCCAYLRQGTQLPEAEEAFLEAALVSLADAPASFARSSNASSCAACSPPTVEGEERRGEERRR